MKKIAIIGMGKMGSKYAKMILENQELDFELVASTRINEENSLKIKNAGIFAAVGAGILASYALISNMIKAKDNK